MPIIINPIFNTADEITQKKYETQLEYSKILKWGRKNPEKFISKFLAVELNDAQKYAVMNAWQTRQSVLVCSRSFGKSFLMKK